MKTRSFLFSLIALLSLPAHAAVFPDIGEECAVTVRFGSYCCGIDGTALASVKSYADEDASVARTVETFWGREGETDICLVPVSGVNATRIYERVKSLLPAHSERGSIELIGRDGSVLMIGEPVDEK